MLKPELIALFAIFAFGLCVFLIGLWLKYRERRQRRKWSAMTCEEQEAVLMPFAGRPSRWCKEFMRTFSRTQADVYIPAMVALYEKQCRERFGSKG
jgi:hypothetical protein